MDDADAFLRECVNSGGSEPHERRRQEEGSRHQQHDRQRSLVNTAALRAQVRLVPHTHRRF